MSYWHSVPLHGWVGESGIPGTEGVEGHVPEKISCSLLAVGIFWFTMAVAPSARADGTCTAFLAAKLRAAQAKNQVYKTELFHASRAHQACHLQRWRLLLVVDWRVEWGAEGVMPQFRFLEMSPAFPATKPSLALQAVTERIAFPCFCRRDLGNYGHW
jgi:hypothetical protein